MRVALINPPWSFEGSIYFGCRDAHLPLELGYAQALLAAAGHDAEIFDAQLFATSLAELRERVRRFSPGLVVVTTAPSYLFWRCAPPELRVPMETLQSLDGLHCRRVVVGPHGSTTPKAVLRKLRADAVVLGECESVLVELAARAPDEWDEITSLATVRDGEVRVSGAPSQVDMRALPALRWSPAALAKHLHHHHRFDAPPSGPGAEIEASRGCPYHCTFCAKTDFRDGYRKRPLEVVLDELDGLIERGARYVYFVDEIFLPDRQLLEALREREVQFGVQLRIDNWSPETLDLLGAAGCVSVEAGVESLTEAGRSLLAKRCKLTTEELTELLVHAKTAIPFVQANLLDAKTDSPSEVSAWRAHLAAHGVWANEPVPMFPYPGSPGYRQRWGAPDDRAWERAHHHYLTDHARFSDIQDDSPLGLEELERGGRG